MADSTDSGKVSPPGRRKRRRALWIAGSVLLLVTALITAHVVWGRVCQARLRREVQALRQAGEPMLPEDFTQPWIPDAENAAVELRAAYAGIDEKDPRFVALDELKPLSPLTPRETMVITSALDAFSASFAQVDAAMNRSGANWNTRIRTPALTVLQPQLKPLRDLSRLLAADLLYAHQQGDDARAVHRALEIRFIGKSLSHEPFLTANLISNAISDTASKRLGRIASDLKIGGTDGATPEQIRLLINSMVDRKSEDASVHFALRSERMMDVDALRAVVDGKMGIEGTSGGNRDNLEVFLLKPAIANEALFLLRYASEVIGRVGMLVPPDWPACRSLLPPPPPDFQAHPDRYHFSRMLMPAFDRVLKQYYLNLTDESLAAAALAIRWYRVDHGGKFPINLSDLVPHYLPQLPADPMAAGSALIYRARIPAGLTPLAASAPVIYSVGDNGNDDGGDSALDFVVYLTPQPRKQNEDSEEQPGAAPTSAPSTIPGR